MPPSELRNFLERNFGERVTKVSDRPDSALPNFVEGFLLETTDVITDALLLVMLQRHYIGATINVRDGGFYWIMRPNRQTLLLTIINYSEIGGAQFFGGDPKHGGISITVTKHPEV